MSLYEKKVSPTEVFCNNLVAVDADWSYQSTGSLQIDQNKTSKVALIKLDNVPVGAKIIKVTTHLGINAGSGGSKDTDITISVRKVVNKAAGVTDEEIEAVSTVTYQADTKADIEADIDAEEVKAGYSYYVRVTASTDADAACDSNELIGATVKYQ